MPDGGFDRTPRQMSIEYHLRKNSPGGEISRKAERRISQAIDWLLWLTDEKEFLNRKTKRLVRFKLNFVTLTLASRQIHSDNEIKSKLLNNFLTVARQKWGCVHYVWRAEAQKNGNIHFHIVFDKFIPWNEIRNSWNRIQNILGYVDRFKAKHGNKTPNSTDIHSIYKLRNIAAYLGKYIAKNSPHRLIGGKLWGLSQSLSRMRSAQVMADGQVWDEFLHLKETFSQKVKDERYFSCIYTKVNDWCKVVAGRLWQEFSAYVNQFRKKPISGVWLGPRKVPEPPPQEPVPDGWVITNIFGARIVTPF